jgi:hypothetical protein
MKPDLRSDAFFWTNALIAFFFGALGAAIVSEASSPSGLFRTLVLGSAVRLVFLNCVGAVVGSVARLVSSQRNAAPRLSMAIQVALAGLVMWEGLNVTTGASAFLDEVGKLGLFLGANVILGLTALFDLARTNGAQRNSTVT